MQEEAKRRRSRITEDFMETSETLRGMRETGLALDEGNFRIPGKNPQVFLEECSLRELAAECIVDRNGQPVGQTFIHEMFAPNDHSKQAHLRMTRMREAGDINAVDYTMFSGITGQLLINSTLKGWDHEEFKFTRAAGTYNTQFIDGERLPGVSLPYTPDIAEAKEDQLLIKAQEPFPYLTMGENYKILPGTEMRGGIMGVDRLAIYGDRTGLVAKNAARGAELLGIRKEQRGLQLLIGNDTVPYKEKFLFDSKEVTIDPYQRTGATAVVTQLTCTTAATWGAGSLSQRPFPFLNDVPSNPINDWHAFETADQYQSKLVDPNNGLPITFGSLPTLFACYTDRFNIGVVLQAFSTWRISASISGLSGDGGVNTLGPNPVTAQLGNLDVQVSRMLRQEMIKSGLYSEAGVGTPQSDKVWFYGNFKEAIQYITNWNIKVIMAPAGSEAEFNQDIILRWRFDERGRWGWFEPRYVQRHNFQSPT